MAGTGEGGGRASSRQELRRSEERFRLLVESVVDYAIFMLDPDGIIATWNAGAERVKGYTADEIIGQHYSIFYIDEYLDAGLPEALLHEARVRGHVEHSGWRVRKDGTRFWANVVITALFEDDGTLAGFAKVTRDVTELHIAQEQREEALAERQRNIERLEAIDEWRRSFISSIAHDLQTPVSAIVGFTELILEDGIASEQHRHFLDRILSNAESLESLIEHLRTFLRLEAGKVELELEPVDLRRFVADLLADLEPVVGTHEVELDIDTGEVWADVVGLARILRNLLANVARYTAPGTPVHLRGRRTPGGIVVEVADEGGGIDDELLPRLFDRFERGKIGGGMGLGLSIVKQYVDLHGGDVEVESEIGRGTTVRFTIPDEVRTEAESA